MAGLALIEWFHDDKNYEMYIKQSPGLHIQAAIYSSNLMHGRVGPQLKLNKIFEVADLALAGDPHLINACDLHGNSPLSFALLVPELTPHHIELAEGLIARNADINMRQPSTGFSFLHVLCNQRNALGPSFEDSLKVLLSLPSIDVNALDASGNTPLHYAALGISKKSQTYKSSESEFGVDLLLKARADFSIRNLEGRTALLFAFETVMPDQASIKRLQTAEAIAKDISTYNIRSAAADAAASASGDCGSRDAEIARFKEDIDEIAIFLRRGCDIGITLSKEYAQKFVVDCKLDTIKKLCRRPSGDLKALCLSVGIDNEEDVAGIIAGAKYVTEGSDHNDDDGE